MSNKVKTILSVDLGGTKLLIGEVTKDGEILNKKKFFSDVTSQERALNSIKEAIVTYWNNGCIGEVIAIGISAVGRINIQDATWYEINPKISEPINLRTELKDITKLPIFAANDVNCATIAEKILGDGKNVDDFIYINFGTGIAAGIVQGKKLLFGSTYNSGEVGHMVVDYDSPTQCICGRYGCVEPLASGLGISERAKELIDKYPSTNLKEDQNGRIGLPELIKAYEDNDPIAQTVLNRATQAAACLIMNLVYTTDPKKVILGGGMLNGGWFIKHIKEYLNDEAMRFVTDGLEVTNLNPNEIALKGAAMLALKEGKV